MNDFYKIRIYVIFNKEEDEFKQNVEIKKTKIHENEAMTNNKKKEVRRRNRSTGDTKKYKAYSSYQG
jgi:hypothetical protein